MAQIVTAERAAIGAPLLARSADLVAKEEDVSYAWHIESRSPGGRCAILEVAGTPEAHFWGTAGDHRIYLAVAVAGLDNITNEIHFADVEITNDPPPPEDDRLVDLVSKESAAALALLHSDWAQAVADGAVASREEFDIGYNVDRDSLQLGDASQAYLIVDERLKATEGIGRALAGELKAIAEDFGSKPQPPPLISGPRIALVVRETSNDTPQRASEFVKLRSGVEADYLEDNGHRVYILDDDAKDGDGRKAPLLKKYEQQIREAGIPTLIIVDAKTEKVLSVQRLQPSFTANTVTQQIRKTGG